MVSLDVESKMWYRWTYLQNRNRLTNFRFRGEISIQGRDSLGVWNGHVHTAILTMDNQQGPIVWHWELGSMLCGSMDGRNAWGRMDTYIYTYTHTHTHTHTHAHTHTAESLPCSPETTTTLLMGYSSKQSKSF